MTRYTKTDVRNRLEVVNKFLASHGKTPIDLRVWSPGDGQTRYEALINNESGRQVFFALGARDAWDKLNVFMRGFEYA